MSTGYTQDVQQLKLISAQLWRGTETVFTILEERLGKVGLRQKNGALLFPGAEDRQILFLCRISVPGFPVSRVDDRGRIWISLLEKNACDYVHSSVRLPNGQKALLRAASVFGFEYEETFVATSNTPLYADLGVSLSNTPRELTRPGDFLALDTTVEHLAFGRVVSCCAGNEGAITLAVALRKLKNFAPHAGFFETDSQALSLIKATQPRHICLVDTVAACSAEKKLPYGEIQLGKGPVIVSNIPALCQPGLIRTKHVQFNSLTCIKKISFLSQQSLSFSAALLPVRYVGTPFEIFDFADVTELCTLCQSIGEGE